MRDHNPDGLSSTVSACKPKKGLSASRNHACCMENTCTEVERTSCLASASCSAVRSIGWWPSGRLGMFESESAFSQQLVLCSQPRRAWAVQVSAQQPVKNTAFEIHHACQRQGLARPQPGAADGIEDTAGKRDSQLPRRAHMVELALLRASQAPASLLPGRSAVPIGATWQGRGDAELHTATLRCTMNMTRDAFEILRVLHEPAHVPQAGPGAPRPARTECWTWPKAPGRVVSRSGMLGPWSSWAARLCGTPSGVWRQTCWREIAMRTRRRTITVSKGAARVAPSRHGLLGRIRLGEPFLWPRRSGDAGAGLARCLPKMPSALHSGFPWHDAVPSPSLPVCAQFRQSWNVRQTGGNSSC